MPRKETITVLGAGIIGLWQALTLAKRGHTVTLVEKSPEPFTHAASRYAGAMLAPDCEAEAAPALVRDQGAHGLTLWRAAYPNLIERGSLVLAQPRDLSELTRFARATTNHASLEGAAIATLEPTLEGRFSRALFFENEAHMVTPDALAFLLKAAKKAGANLAFGASHEEPAGITIDCRGLAARDVLPDLRGVRGECLVLRTREVTLHRPVRLLHPRHPLYVVPWTDNRFLIGATVIESEDPGPMTVRSALELLGTTYALHPAFAEAEILDMGAGVRPAFPDNVPRARVSNNGRRIMVNGAYRHGFLLAPVLAEAVANHIDRAEPHPLLDA